MIFGLLKKKEINGEKVGCVNYWFTYVYGVHGYYDFGTAIPEK